MKVKAELDEIKAGLETLGVLQLLQQNPITMRELFVATYDVLTADMLQDLFTVEYSLRGSNERDREEETILHWISLLQEIEG